MTNLGAKRQEQLHFPTHLSTPHHPSNGGGHIMGRYLLLWLLGVPIPILLLIYAFGGLH